MRITWFNKITIYTVIFLSFLFPLSIVAQSSEKTIEDVFQEYKKSISEERMEDAATFLDSNTRNYFKTLLHHIYYSDSLALDTLPALDKFWIILMRQSITKDELLLYTDLDLTIYFLQQLGLISIFDINISKIMVDNNIATAEIRQKKDQIPGELKFYKEEGGWKIDMRRSLIGSQDLFELVIIESGKSVNEVILEAVEEMNGSKPASTIWNNLK
ncbi:MAG: hypothetical protein WBB36_08650 [Chitinophagales bacterium]